MSTATGFCFKCGAPVPEHYPNKFYCGEACRRVAWREYHPTETEPDWDQPPLSGACRNERGNWRISL